MSNSPLVDYTLISPNRYVMSGKQNKKITVHHMAGNLTVEQCGKVFQPTSRQASTNYGIGSDGRIGMYVPEKDGAWASCNYQNDTHAVTMEVANSTGSPSWEVSSKAWSKLVDLCTDICLRNGIKELVWTGTPSGTLTCHYMFAATACPGPYLKARMKKLAKLVNARLKKTKGYTVTATTYVYKNRKAYKNNHVRKLSKGSKVYVMSKWKGKKYVWGKLSDGSGYVILDKTSYKA